MSKDNGGPAFPFEYHNQTNRSQDGFFDTGPLAPGASQQFAGMSLRDYFAAKAPADDLNIPESAKGCAEKLGIDVKDYTYAHFLVLMARARYEWADAMLAERAK